MLLLLLKTYPSDALVCVSRSFKWVTLYVLQNVKLDKLGQDGINRTEGELEMCKVMGENTNQTFLMLEVE